VGERRRRTEEGKTLSGGEVTDFSCLGNRARHQTSHQKIFERRTPAEGRGSWGVQVGRGINGEEVGSFSRPRGSVESEFRVQVKKKQELLLKTTAANTGNGKGGGGGVPRSRDTEKKHLRVKKGRAIKQQLSRWWRLKEMGGTYQPGSIGAISGKSGLGN